MTSLLGACLLKHIFSGISGKVTSIGQGQFSQEQSCAISQHSSWMMVHQSRVGGAFTAFQLLFLLDPSKPSLKTKQFLKTALNRHITISFRSLCYPFSWEKSPWKHVLRRITLTLKEPGPCCEFFPNLAIPASQLFKASWQCTGICQPRQATLASLHMLFSIHWEFWYPDHGFPQHLCVTLQVHIDDLWVILVFIFSVQLVLLLLCMTTPVSYCICYLFWKSIQHSLFPGLLVGFPIVAILWFYSYFRPYCSPFFSQPISLFLFLFSLNLILYL